MAVKFHKGRHRRPRIYSTGVMPEQKPPEGPLGTIQGIPAMSREEWYVALALWTLKASFTYQVRVRGGAMLRGGQTVDFVVNNPFPTPVQVFGEYWHTGRLGADDSYQLAELEAYFKTEVVVLWGKELTSEDEALATVKTRLKL